MPPDPLLKSIRALAMRLGHAYALDWEDLEQEGLLAWLQCKDRHTGAGNCSIGSFTYWRIKGSMTDYARRWHGKSKYRREAVAAMIPRKVRTPEEILLHSRGRPQFQLRAKLETLGRKQRIVFTLRYYYHWAPEEVSSALSLSRSYVSQLSAQAFRLLREEVIEDASF